MLPGRLRNVETREITEDSRRTESRAGPTKGGRLKPGQSADGDGSWNLR